MTTTTRAMKTKPDWAGDDALSKLVDAAISNELLYERVMKPMARWTLIDTAEKNGIRWREEAKRLREDEDVKRAYEAIKDEGIEYPEYYLKPFHAYAEGNLCWLAATEAESATYSMALRVWPKERVTAETAQRRLRDSYTDAIKEHRETHGSGETTKILDVGC